ncbi:MAG: PPOX class F420-dependent oxidoreductase [Actinobacteria bacterium 13_2_20CM_2_66_6]|nr:MAG: PPOX class F420-dependent oxidoreductase [Actinobacteria bacterium 13_2_20CM_2_66_6]
MDASAMRSRILEARVARLATADAEGRPHIVPISFALDDNAIFFAVDAKPKRTTDLKRLRNIAANPAVAVLFDHYEDDWSRLWWVRIDGAARIVDDELAAARAIDLLAGRYEQYLQARPGGPVVAISIERMSGWSAR